MRLPVRTAEDLIPARSHPAEPPVAADDEALPPEEGEFLRRQYADIIPGYYMNKQHWNSVYLDGAVPDDVLRGMVDQSYALLLASLTKQQRAQVTGA